MDIESHDLASVALTAISRTFGRHICQECGVKFTATHNRQTTFCCTDHKTSFQDRERVRGRVMVKLVQAWRKGKKTKIPRIREASSFAFQEIAALGDLFNQEDAAAGRPSATEYVMQMIIRGYRPSVDRQSAN